MPDISMCAGDNCTIAEHCHRFTVAPGRNQSWLTPEMTAKGCLDFLPAAILRMGEFMLQPCTYDHARACDCAAKEVKCATEGTVHDPK